MDVVASALDKLGFCLLTCAVVAAPIPFGSNSADFAGVLGIALALCLLSSLVVPLHDASRRRLYFGAMLLCTALTVWSVAQVVPWESASWNNAIWDHARRVLDVSPGSIAASRYQPLHSVGYVLMPIAAFISSLVYVYDEARYITFVHFLLGAGIAVTVFAIAQYTYAPQDLLWTEKRHYLSSLTGTFVNPNSAAIYFGLMLLMALAMSFYQFEQVGRSLIFSNRANWSPSKRRRMLILTIYGAAAFVFSLALLLTKSRAGILSTLVGVASFVGVYAFSMLRRTVSLRRAAALTVFLLAGAAAYFVVSGERVLRRVYIEGLVDHARLCTYRSTWRAVEDNYRKGTGLGTFQDVFPIYKSPECGLTGYWEAAHNDFLEGWLSLGVAFPACLFMTYAALLVTYLTGLHERSKFRFVPLSCLAILMIVSLHSLVDFSLHIPALAVLVASLLGAGAALSKRRIPHAEGGGEARVANPSD